MYISIYSIIIVSSLTFIAGFIDSIAGGGGLISLPAYLLVGLPPHLAIGTNKLSSILGTTVAFFRFLKGGKINWRSALVSAAFSLPGSYLGVRLSLLVNEIFLRYVLIIVLPFIILLVLKCKGFGSEDTSARLPVLKIILLTILTGFVVGTYNGFFGPGAGMFLILAYTGLIGFSMATASGNAKLVDLVSNIVALATFSAMGKVVYLIGIPAAVSGMLGNWIGSGLAVRNGAKVIRPIFLMVVLLLFLKLLYDLLKITF